MKNGAVVHGARDEVVLQRVVDKLGVGIVLAAAKPPRIGLNKGEVFLVVYYNSERAYGEGEVLAIIYDPVALLSAPRMASM